MKLSEYIRLDHNYKYSLINTDIRSLGIGCVGMAVFCGSILNWGFRTTDHISVLIFYMICFSVAQAFFIYPLVMVFEEGYTSIFKKFKNIPINKRLFFRSKLLLLTRFTILFCIPVQLFHFWGLTRTNTSYLSITGFWPVLVMLVSLLAQYFYLRLLTRKFW